jgi:hypothetical protein
MFGRLNGAARETIDVPLDKVAQIVLLARSFDAPLDYMDGEDAGDGLDTRSSLTPEAAIDDPVESELRRAIDDLSDDEQAVLVALVWIGRGDFASSEFDQALTMAFERRAGRTSDYLLGFPMLGDLIEQGASACGADLSETDA